MAGSRGCAVRGHWITLNHPAVVLCWRPPASFGECCQAAFMAGRVHTYLQPPEGKNEKIERAAELAELEVLVLEVWMRGPAAQAGKKGWGRGSKPLGNPMSSYAFQAAF